MSAAPTDAGQIRALVQRWMEATKAGDVPAVLDLMTDDVVFLVPGRPPMRKADFAAAAASQAAGGPCFDGRSDIREIQVAGDWAFAWSRLEVVATPADGSPPMRREGHTLTVFRKEAGRWRLARDANLLGAPQPA